MKDIDSLLRDYAKQWRAEQPALSDDLRRDPRPPYRRTALVVSAAVAFVLLGAGAIAITHQPVAPRQVLTRPDSSAVGPIATATPPSEPAPAGATSTSLPEPTAQPSTVEPSTQPSDVGPSTTETPPSEPAPSGETPTSSPTPTAPPNTTSPTSYPSPPATAPLVTGSATTAPPTTAPTTAPTPTSTSTPTSTPTTIALSFCTATPLRDAPLYLGLTLEQAQALAASRSEILRVVEQDGVPVVVTAEGNPHRVDVYLASGTVTQACHE